MNLAGMNAGRAEALLMIRTGLKFAGRGGFMAKTATQQIYNGCKELTQGYARADQDYYGCDRYEHDKLERGLIRCAGLIADSVIKGAMGNEFEQQLKQQVESILKNIAVSGRKKEKEEFGED